MASSTSSLAVGCRSTHRNVVSAPCALVPAGSPLASTFRPFGTVTVKSYVALSWVVSLTGYQVADPNGWDSATAPSWVAIQPETPSDGSLISCGTPE